MTTTASVPISIQSERRRCTREESAVERTADTGRNPPSDDLAESIPELPALGDHLFKTLTWPKTLMEWDVLTNQSFTGRRYSGCLSHSPRLVWRGLTKDARFRSLKHFPARGFNMGMRISVIGTGYLGAAHAAGLAKLGHHVVAVDRDAAKVAALSSGHVPFYEPELEELVNRQLSGGRLAFTTSVADAAAATDAHFVCVGTPQRRGSHAADLSALEGAFEEVGRHAKPGSLIIGKSTVPVGTAHRLAERLARERADVEVAWNPEFLREGHAVEDTLRPARIVVGVQSEKAEHVLRTVYERPIAGGSPFIVTDLSTAELSKSAANSFLATKISFINAMAELCEATGSDVIALTEVLGHDPRIGPAFLGAGLGFGGGCLPKDIRAFMARAGELGVDQALTFLREVDAINMRQRHRVVELAHRECDGNVLGKRIAVLGAAFKPDSDDVRDSPALNVAAQLQLQGGQIMVYDPRASLNAAQLFPTLSYADSLEEAARDADLVLHLTEWAEFRSVDPEQLGQVVAKRRILDARNALDSERWRTAGWAYRALGRP